MKINRLYNLGIYIVAAILIGCADDDFIDSTGRFITFEPDPTFSVSYTTRAGAMTDIASLPDFGVSATAYDGNSTYAEQELGNYFYNLKCTKGVATSYIWPAKSKKMSFYAYAPYGAEGLSFSNKGTKDIPTYNYTVPSNLDNQVDLMTASAVDMSCASKENVMLSFSHRLSNIRFSLYNKSTSSLTLKSISICGVKYSGTFKSEWSLIGSANSLSSYPFTLSVNKEITSKATLDATGEDKQFFVIPQTVATGTEFLVVKTEEGGSEKTYTYKLPNALTLEMSKSHTFKLELGNGTLIVDPATDVEEWEEFKG